MTILVGNDSSVQELGAEKRKYRIMHDSFLLTVLKSTVPKIKKKREERRKKIGGRARKRRLQGG